MPQITASSINQQTPEVKKTPKTGIKRLSKGLRKHARRQKQAARSTSVARR